MTHTATAPFLSSHSFLDMIKAGANKVISHESYLNKLNVFPVPDGDTGSNLAALMRFILAQRYSTELPALLKQIADASLYGACGNSGTIFSAFLVGIASNSYQFLNNAFTKEQFSACLEAGINYAYKTVAEPKEGTILTVMTAWITAYKSAAQYSNKLFDMLQNSLVAAEEALKKTEFQLPVLKKHHVVDAGAMGFVTFLQGMYEYLTQPEKEMQTVSPATEKSTHLELDSSTHWHEESAYSFCVEALVTSKNIEWEKIKKQLEPFCDSLVVNQSPSYTKFHLHTDQIKKSIHIIKQLGTIQYQKIDNMKKQMDIVHHRKYPIALVTDSCADLPEEWMTQEQIHVLPIQIHLDEHVLLDRLSVDLDEVYEGIEAKKSARTSAPNPESVRRYLSFLAVHYESILVVTLSAELSGAYQIIASQAETITQTPIEVIDSKKNSAAQGLLVMMAARLISAGNSFNEISQKIKSLREHTSMYVAVGNFKTMAKLGRAPKFLRQFIEWTRLKPILSLNPRGGARIRALAFGKKHCWSKVARLVLRHLKSQKIKSACVVYSTSFEKAQEFAAFITQKTGVKIDFIRETSCSIGLHAGRGCLAIGFSSGELT
jgi:DegV family protein with EDD domain